MKVTSMADWANPYQPSESDYAMHFLTNPFATTEVNGLVTPLSLPSSADSCFNEGYTPLEEMQTQHQDCAYSFPKQVGYSNAFWPRQYDLAPQYPTYQPPLYRDTYHADRNMPFTYAPALDMYTGTAPPTPDFLAVSDEAVLNSAKPMALVQSKDEVLVGMGLYDGPSPPNSTALYGNIIAIPNRESAGKGLKLEETFQPSNEEDDEDDDDSNCDCDEDQEAFLSAPTHQPSLLGDSLGVPEVATFANQSFFFDNEADEEQFLPANDDHHLAAPIWTDVYSGAPCNWI